MNYLQLFVDSFTHYPKSSLLSTIAALNIGWVCYVVFVRKNFGKSIYRAYFFYAILVLLWVISNAYFQSSFLTALGTGVAKFMALFANAASSLALTSFYYISCLLKNPKQKATWFNKAFTLFSVLYFLVLNLIPGLTVERVDIASNENFEIVFSPWNFLFFGFGLILILLGFINFIIATKTEKGKIEKVKFFYTFFGISLMYGSVVVFHIALPTLFQNYSYAWVPPALSILDILIVGYGLLVKRFSSIRLVLSKLIKSVVVFCVSIALIYFFGISLLFVFSNEVSAPYIYLAVFAAFILIYNALFSFFNSRLFPQLFGITEVEYFRKKTGDFQAKNIVYGTLEEFEKDIYKLFYEDLKIDAAEIIILNARNRRSYVQLIRYCRTHPKILVTKEIQFLQEESGKPFPFFKELQKLGEICLPLYHPSKGLLGFFVLGKKTADRLYTKEEIESLEYGESYLSLKLIEITYNAELQKEVAVKTRSLQAQNAKIQDQNKKITVQNREIGDLLSEKTKLLAQQSDFLALTAHELRTPLTIALLRTDDMLARHKDKEITEDLEAMDKILKKLKDLTDKLFEVLQYDLNKINVSPEKVNVFEFIERIYEDFEPLMQEKLLVFSIQNKLTRNLVSNLDPVYFRQLMQNLLVNAIKFTPVKGKILLTAKEDRTSFTIGVSDSGEGVPQRTKKTIFDKFTSNHAMQSPGIGLGLYVCKKIVDLHHGKIWVEDNLTGGAVFCVNLPKSK